MTNLSRHETTSTGNAKKTSFGGAVYEASGRAHVCLHNSEYEDNCGSKERQVYPDAPM